MNRKKDAEIFRPDADKKKIRRSCAAFDKEAGSCRTLTETVCAYHACSFFISQEKLNENRIKSIRRRKMLGFPLKKSEEEQLEKADGGEEG